MFANLARLLSDNKDTVIVTLSRSEDKFHCTVTQRADPGKGIKDDRLANSLRQPIAFTGTMDELVAEFDEQLGRHIGERVTARERFQQLSADLHAAEQDANERLKGKPKKADAAPAKAPEHGVLFI